MNSINALLRACLQRPIAYHRVFAKVGGGITAGLLLSQLFYWSDKGSDPDGWIYKTQAEIEDETALTRWEQESARKSLRKLGLLEETKRGLPAKLYYRVNISALMEAISGSSAPSSTKDVEKPHTVGCVKISSLPEQQTGTRKNLIPACGKSSVKDVEKPQPIICTETTTEITQRQQQPARPSEVPFSASSDAVVLDAKSNQNPPCPIYPQSSPILADAKVEVSQRIIASLVEQGVTPACASQIAKKHDPAFVQKQLNALTYRRPRDRAATLVKAITENWSLPTKMINEAREERKKAHDCNKQAESQAQREMANADKKVLEDEWDKIDEEVHTKIITEAKGRILTQSMGDKLLASKLTGGAVLRAKCIEIMLERKNT